MNHPHSVAFGFVAASAIALAGCGKAQEKASEKVAERIIESTTRQRARCRCT